MSYRIRILAGGLDRSAGSHIYHHELITRLASRGHEVSVVCFQSQPAIEQAAEVCVIPRPDYSQSPFLWRFGSLMAYGQFRRSLVKARLPRADVVVAGEHLFLKPHAQRFPDTPWIYLPHALYTDREIGSYGLPLVARQVTKQLYRHLQQWALTRAACTMRFTRRACQALAARYQHAALRRFVVNPAGIEVPSETARPANDRLRLLTVGRLVESKGIDMALRVLSRLTDRAWSYDIVGDGPQRHSLERQAADLGLIERVRFHGHQSQPERWYRSADLFLFPSRSESLGLVLLEAMSHGICCLAMRDDGKEFQNVNEEIVTHGRTGLLAEGESGLEAMLSAVFGSAIDLSSLGAAARAEVTTRFTWDRHLDRYESLFAELVDRRATPNCARTVHA